MIVKIRQRKNLKLYPLTMCYFIKGHKNVPSYFFYHYENKLFFLFKGEYSKIDGYKGCLLNGNNNNYKIRFSLELYS